MVLRTWRFERIAVAAVTPDVGSPSVSRRTVGARDASRGSLEIPTWRPRSRFVEDLASRSLTQSIADLRFAGVAAGRSFDHSEEEPAKATTLKRSTPTRSPMIEEKTVLTCGRLESMEPEMSRTKTMSLGIGVSETPAASGEKEWRKRPP